MRVLARGWGWGEGFLFWSIPLQPILLITDSLATSPNPNLDFTHRRTPPPATSVCLVLAHSTTEPKVTETEEKKRTRERNFEKKRENTHITK